MLALSVDYKDDITAGEVKRINTELEKEIKSDFPEVKRLFLEVQSTQDHIDEVARANAARAKEE